MIELNKTQIEFLLSCKNSFNELDNYFFNRTLEELKKEGYDITNLK